MVSHRARPEVVPTKPMQIVLELHPELPLLTTKRMWQAAREALSEGAESLGLRICEFAARDRRLDLVVEADDTTAMCRGVQGVAIRLARRLNGATERQGRVWKDRYDVRQLATNDEVIKTLASLFANAKLSSASADHGVTLSEPKTGLLKSARRARA